MTQDETQDEGQAPDDATPSEEPAQGAPEPVPAEDPPAEVPDEADIGPSAPSEALDEETTASTEDLAVDPAPAEEAPAEDAEAAEDIAADPAPAEEVPAETATEEAPDAPSEPAAPPHKKDEAPGANLEPLLIEDKRELSAEERARLEAEREEAEAKAAAEVADPGDEPAVREGAKLQMGADQRIQATGKRKTAVARVVVVKGKGEIVVNRKSLGDFFPRSLHQTIARQALVTSGYEDQVDVKVRVHGGGVSGQADAVRHGIARALVEIDPELRGELKRRGMLTRDARAKERRKAGLKKARKRPQFSKR